MALTKTSKNYEVSSKILNQQFFFYLLKLVCTSKKNVQNFINYKQTYLQIFRSIFKIFLINHKQLNFHVTNIDAQKKFQKFKTFKSRFLTLFPKVFTEFAKNQIAATSAVSLTSNSFNRSLQRNLLKLIEIILRKYRYDILGIKLICSGK